MWGVWVLGGISAWVGIGLSVLVMCASCVAYIHALINGVHGRISSARDHTEEKIAEARTEFRGEIVTEREERRREQDRLERAIDSFATVGSAVTALVEGVKHLGERFEDNRQAQNRALDEIKHGMRGMDTKINAITREQMDAR